MTSSSSATLLGALDIKLGGVHLFLLPDRAVWWPVAQTLLIADPHLGKATAFRTAGLPIPDATAADLARLDRLLLSTSARRLIVLGDLLHNRRGMSRQLIEQVQHWRAEHPQLSVELIRGNHDLASGDPPEQWDIQVHAAPLMAGPFQLTHHPDWGSSKPSMAGHLHPKYLLYNRNEDLRLPCFWLQNETLVLPAFGTFVDGDLIRGNNHRVFVIADTDVIEVPASSRSS